MIHFPTITTPKTSTTGYWKSDGSSTATGVWNLGSYGIITPSIDTTLSYLKLGDSYVAQWGITASDINVPSMFINNIVNIEYETVLMPSSHWAYGGGGLITIDWGYLDWAGYPKVAFPQGIVSMADRYLSLDTNARYAYNTYGIQVFSWNDTQFSVYTPAYFSTGFSTYYESTIYSKLNLANGSYFDTSGYLALATSGYNSPAIYCVSDTNTGIWFDGTDGMGIVTAGAKRFSIDSSGRVILGNATGSGILTIKSNSSGAIVWDALYSGNSNPIFRLTETGGTEGVMTMYSSGGSVINRFQTSGVNYILGGNFGVGTSSPTAKIHSLATTEQLRVGYNTSNYYSTTVSSVGAVLFDAVGTSPKFVFSDALEATTIKVTTANGYKSSDGSSGATVNVSRADGTVDVYKDGLYIETLIP